MQPLTTEHRFYTSPAHRMDMLADRAVDLVVTSPPYPMIAMWDESFTEADPAIGLALEQQDGGKAFELMHQTLDGVWMEAHRVLRDGGILCVNIGDAVRSLAGEFRLYSNHSRILSSAVKTGFVVLPCLIWRKPTNAPNKFMGSGMLPAGAYVTLEHEHILILRKGGRRRFETPASREARRRSAYFWEERNRWFSDQWDILGARQEGAAGRTAAFPLTIPYRLILMYSAYGDTVFDPFCGTGTTLAAAAAAGRNSVGLEIREELRPGFERALEAVPAVSAELAEKRLRAHMDFVEEQTARDRAPAHQNKPHGFAVKTAQETDMELLRAETVEPVPASGPHGEAVCRVRYVRAETAVYRQGTLF